MGATTGEGHGTAAADRPLRADVRRNREALLASAVAAFTARGADASLEEVARGAGVGIGTLYRHFPTREALVEAVYRREVAMLTGGVDDLLARLPADKALAEWMRRFVAQVAAKRGMSTALKTALGPDSTVFATARTEILATAARLLDAAAADGLIRADVPPEDLLRGLSGFCTVSDTPGWEDQAQRLVALLVDGLRYRAAAERRPGGRSASRR
jgi:AcrR family transcriptional regulator